MVDAVLALPEGTKVMILSPLVVERKGEQADLIDELRCAGFVRLRINGQGVRDGQPAEAGQEQEAHHLKSWWID